MFSPATVIRINAEVGETGKLLKPNELDSAFASLDYVDSPELKVAYVVRSVMQNHPFVDGNKRTGMVLLVAGLETLGHTVRRTDDEIVQFAVDSVTNRFSPQKILAWALD